MAPRWADGASPLPDRPSVVATGYIGSYALGEADIGSDLDPVVVRLDGTSEPDLLGADVAALPVPADILHDTEDQLHSLIERRGRMADVLEREARWWIGGSLTGQGDEEDAGGARRV